MRHQDYEKMLEMRRSGSTYAEIARALGFASVSTVIQVLGLRQSAGSVFDLPDIRIGESDEQRVYRRHPIDRHKPSWRL